MKLLPFKRRTPVPTDLEILDAILERHWAEFPLFSEENRQRDSKIYVPIDIAAIAGQLQVDQDIVFGRLYYDLNKRYGYSRDDGSKVPLFTPVAGKDRNCVNFPFLTSLVAALREEDRKYETATRLAYWSLLIAVVSLVIAVFSSGAL